MVMKVRLLAFAMLILALPAAVRADETAKPSAISVEVTGFRTDNGQLGCSLFKGPDGFPRDGSKVFRHMWAPIKDGRAVCIFPGVPAADYAVTIFHDENGNKKFDSNFVGYPLEGYGFSNNVKPVFESARVRRMQIPLQRRRRKAGTDHNDLSIIES